MLHLCINEQRIFTRLAAITMFYGFYNQLYELFCFLLLEQCQPDSCMNNAACVEGNNDIQCNCQPGFEGIRCEISKFQM